MRAWLLLVISLSGALRMDAAEELLHTERKFEFTVPRPPDVVAPLFGANRERVWATGWDPAFVWPAKANDQPGMVFTVAHGDRQAVWVNTRLEPTCIQYVYTLPDVVATVVTLRLAPKAQAPT